MTTDELKETKSVIEISDLSSSEVEARSPGEGNIEFRSRIPEDTLEKIKRQAPDLALSMLSDPTVSINFGQDVVQQINDLSVKLLKEQDNVVIPQADTIVNDVLRALDGYNAKYKYKEPGKVSKFLKKISNKGKEAAYDLKSMVRDAQPIADKLTAAQGKIHRMELEIDENIVRSQQLRDVTIDSIDNVAVVIAVFEEVIELATKEILEANEVFDKALESGEQIIEYRGKKYSTEEYREVLADMVASLGEIEKTWFNWRQKFFLYIVNITSTREIINTSISLKRTANRVRQDAIPAARNQLAAWQQAARMEETAKTVENANRGMEEIILGASRSQLKAIQTASMANQRQILSEETILELTDNIQKQFSAIIEAEVVGRDVRAKNLELLRNSEQAILNANSEAQKALIHQSVEQLNNAKSTSTSLNEPTSISSIKIAKELDSSSENSTNDHEEAKGKSEAPTLGSLLED